MRRALLARIERLMLDDVYLFQIEMHCVLALRIVRTSMREDSVFDRSVLIRIYRGFDNALLRREVLLLLAAMKDFDGVRELIRESVPSSRWDGRTLEFLRGETGFDAAAAADGRDLCSSALRRWISGRSKDA